MQNCAPSWASFDNRQDSYRINTVVVKIVWFELLFKLFIFVPLEHFNNKSFPLYRFSNNARKSPFAKRPAGSCYIRIWPLGGCQLFLDKTDKVWWNGIQVGFRHFLRYKIFKILNFIYMTKHTSFDWRHSHVQNISIKIWYWTRGRALTHIQLHRIALFRMDLWLLPTFKDTHIHNYSNTIDLIWL